MDQAPAPKKLKAGPSKDTKKKTPQKKKGQKKTQKKKTPPRKILAKQASKKNVKNGDISESQESKALTIQNVGDLDLEAKLLSLKKVMKACETQKVAEHEVQRFLARILALSKECGFLTGVDHAIFKSENNHIRLLEASLNESNLSSKQKKELLDKLLKLALPMRLATEALEQSPNGLSWLPKTRLVFQSDSSSEEEVEVQDRGMMTNTLKRKNETSQTDTLKGKDESVQTEHKEDSLHRTGNRLDL